MDKDIIPKEGVKEFDDQVERLQLHFDKTSDENTRNDVEVNNSPVQ